MGRDAVTEGGTAVPPPLRPRPALCPPTRRAWGNDAAAARCAVAATRDASPSSSPLGLPAIVLVGGAPRGRLAGPHRACRAVVRAWRAWADRDHADGGGGAEGGWAGPAPPPLLVAEGGSLPSPSALRRLGCSPEEESASGRDSFTGGSWPRPVVVALPLVLAAPSPPGAVDTLPPVAVATIGRLARLPSFVGATVGVAGRGGGSGRALRLAGWCDDRGEALALCLCPHTVRRVDADAIAPLAPPRRRLAVPARRLDPSVVVWLVVRGESCLDRLREAPPPLSLAAEGEGEATATVMTTSMAAGGGGVVAGFEVL